MAENILNLEKGTDIKALEADSSKQDENREAHKDIM